MEFVYLPNIYVENSSVLTTLAILADRLLLYDRFSLYNWYRTAWEESQLPEAYRTRVYADPVVRRSSVLGTIGEHHPKGLLPPAADTYFAWLEKHRPLFREEILGLLHVSSAVPSFRLADCHTAALDAAGLSGKAPLEGPALDEYVVIDNFYWALAGAAYHRCPVVLDRPVPYPIPNTYAQMISHTDIDEIDPDEPFDVLTEHDVVDILDPSILYSSIPSPTGADFTAPVIPVENLSAQLALSMALAAFPELPPLRPYEICKLREAVHDERMEVADALKELTAIVVQTVAAGAAADFAEACRFVVDTRIMPAFRRLRRNAMARGNSGFRVALKRLTNPVFLLIKAIDPSETLSKWDVIQDAVERSLGAATSNQEGLAREPHVPERTVALFFLKLSELVKGMRPMKFS